MSQRVRVVNLTNLQYCTVLDPIDGDGKPQLGKRKLCYSEAGMSFFLSPGESLAGGAIKSVYILGEQEALLVAAVETFTDEKAAGSKVHKAGDRWLVKGPCEYIPAGRNHL